MAKPKRARPVCGFTLDPEVARRVQEQADQTGEHKSSIVDAALRAYFKLPTPEAS